MDLNATVKTLILQANTCCWIAQGAKLNKPVVAFTSGFARECALKYTNINKF
jgi:hypothetical protein